MKNINDIYVRSHFTQAVDIIGIFEILPISTCIFDALLNLGINERFPQVFNIFLIMS